MRNVIDKIGDLSEPVSPLLIKNSCCQRAFLRGAFLCIGSMSDRRRVITWNLYAPMRIKRDNYRV